MTDPDDVYLIWSHEHGAWWRSLGGYTPRLSEAGHYSRAAALRVCAHAIPGTGARLGALPEVPVRLADAQAVVTAYDTEHGTRPEPWR